jgi:abortive infection bacteriophage resistance protein
METVQKRVDRARRHNEAIKHYDRKYSGELPIWVLTEVLDFSDLSKLYDALPAKQQWEIAHSLGINIDLEKLTLSQQAKVLKNHPLARWFEQLSIVRNTCAHHGRVWNRSFVPASTTGLRTLQEFQTLPLGQSERIFGALVVMGALLNNVSPGSTWPLKIKKLVNGSFVSLRGREISEMGYPNNFLL